MIGGMSLVFAHPFTVVGGRIATVESESDLGYAQEIAVLCSTLKGERVLVPDYGLTDSVGVGIDVADVNAGLALYGPAGLAVSGLEVTYPGDGVQAATLSFSVEGE